MLIREAELEPAPGLSAITGETGAGKTILAQAVGLLLGAKGDAGCDRRRRARRRTSRPSSTCPRASSTTTSWRAWPSSRRRTSRASSLARRVFADGRTRAYAWGRAVAREDLAAAAERLIAMSGQFEQRRLEPARVPAGGARRASAARSSCAARREARAAWRELAAARRRHDELVARGGGRAGAARASSRRWSRRQRASSRRPRTSCAPSGSGCGT